MKIVYCIPSLLNMGGLKRVLTNKINYLVKEFDYDIVIVTRNQKGNDPYYSLNSKVKVYDISTKNPSSAGMLSKFFCYISILWRYYVSLKKILLKEKPDVTVSVFSLELYFLFLIDDGSKKVVECHGPRYFWSSFPAQGFTKIVRRFRNKLHSFLLRKYNKFIVLTNEDREAWPELNNVIVIPNPAKTYVKKVSNLSNKKVISVGRLSKGKRFDHLIQAWGILHTKYPSWRLDIIGEGELRDNLQELINELGLSSCVKLKGESNNVFEEYLSSSIFVLASEHEGLPMVLLEAMSVGLPLVSYSCPCGPKDLIKNGVNGFLVKPLDYLELADKIMQLISSPLLLEQMSIYNIEEIKKYSEVNIMNKWKNLFESLKK